jgi:hypothetical protein
MSLDNFLSHLVCVMCRYLQVGDITVLVRNISHVILGMRGVCYVLLTFFGTVSLLCFRFLLVLV